MAINMRERLNGKEILGIELGSTRIKAVLVDENCAVLAQGSFAWENEFKDGFWTYSLEAVRSGLQKCFESLNEDCEKKFGERISSLASIGISGMMHGYLPFDENEKLLVPFRTWRNTTTEEAAKKLTALFGFNIPQRWSVAHLYQAFLNNEEHIGSVSSINTLAGYVHFLLSGKRIVGIGEASGMFPVNCDSKKYDAEMVESFNALVSDQGWDILKMLPEIALAGEKAGFLTEEGARLLDPSGSLRPGALMCPPEGDAGTGMVATNSIRPGSGNVSAGTSIFSMVVLRAALSEVHEEIDVVSTPTGENVAMIHCNNCCTEIDKWVLLFESFLNNVGLKMTRNELYDAFFSSALSGDPDCGGVTSAGLFSGEPVARLDDAKPMLLREKDADLSFANLARSVINSSFSTLRIGHDILARAGVGIDYLNGHGGLFKSGKTGQQLMADALKTEIRVSETAGEGGAWGMAILAAFALNEYRSLQDYLDDVVFAGNKAVSAFPKEEGSAGFEKFHARFREAIELMKGMNNV